MCQVIRLLDIGIEYKMTSSYDKFFVYLHLGKLREPKNLLSALELLLASLSTKFEPHFGQMV